MMRKMPNRADHSVKTRRRERDPAIKSLVVAAGAACAVIGALTAMFTGGAAGLFLGAGVLTTIIFLQIFLWLQVQNSAEQAPRPMNLDGTEKDASAEPAAIPVLILGISELGRVRTITGQVNLLPGVRVGSDAEQILSKSRPLSISRLPAADGAWMVLLPGGADSISDESALIERTSFFAGLGHDLKSPLNAVIGFAEIMEAEIRGPLPEAYQDYPGLIRESGQTLLRLVEDMLAYAKSEAGTFELDIAAMDIAASGESVLRQSQAMANKAGVALTFAAHGEVVALADAGAIRSIWDNLVSNAIKYSSSGDTVTLISAVRNGAATIQVRDQGVGMNADDLARIASPFAQGSNAKGRVGTGLGLALVHRLTEMHGGRVKIATAPDAGTTVTVTLPAINIDQERAAE